MFCSLALLLTAKHATTCDCTGIAKSTAETVAGCRSRRLLQILFRAHMCCHRPPHLQRKLKQPQTVQPTTAGLQMPQCRCSRLQQVLRDVMMKQCHSWDPRRCRLGPRDKLRDQHLAMVYSSHTKRRRLILHCKSPCCRYAARHRIDRSHEHVRNVLGITCSTSVNSSPDRLHVRFATLTHSPLPCPK